MTNSKIPPFTSGDGQLAPTVSHGSSTVGASPSVSIRNGEHESNGPFNQLFRLFLSGLNGPPLGWLIRKVTRRTSQLVFIIGFVTTMQDFVRDASTDKRDSAALSLLAGLVAMLGFGTTLIEVPFRLHEVLLSIFVMGAYCLYCLRIASQFAMPNVALKGVILVLGFRALPAAIIGTFFALADIMVLTIAVEDGMPANVHFLDGLVSVFSGIVLWMVLCVQQGRLRHEHDQQAFLLSEVEAQEALLAILCDCAIWLAPDGDTVLKADVRFEQLVGGAAFVGGPFSWKLSEASGDLSRFRAALDRARWPVPELVPVSLLSTGEGGGSVKVELFIVDRRAAKASDTMAQAFGFEEQAQGFMVGIRRQGGGMGADAMPPAARGVAKQHTWTRGSVLQDDECSVPTTTSTALAFGEMADEANLQQRLQRVAWLGRREHWLLSSNQVDLEVPSRVLGAGGFGFVVAGEFEGTPVAIKVPRKGMQTTPVKWSAVLNEMRVLRHMRHPNIVLFHGACIAPAKTSLALVFELVMGKVLSRYVGPEGSPSIACRYKVINDMCSALRYLHAQRPQIIHGDLKPQNVMVEELKTGPKAKLLDFGLSRIASSRAAPLGGTKRWMAPEIVLQAQPKPSANADVYSFGCLVYYTMTDTPPFAGFEADKIVSLTKNMAPPLPACPRTIPMATHITALCKDCLAWSENDRPLMKTLHSQVKQWKTIVAALQPVTAEPAVEELATRPPEPEEQELLIDKKEFNPGFQTVPEQGPPAQVDLAALILADMASFNADATVVWFDSRTFEIFSCTSSFASVSGPAPEGCNLLDSFVDPHSLQSIVEKCSQATKNVKLLQTYDLRVWIARSGIDQRAKVKFHRLGIAANAEGADICIMRAHLELLMETQGRNNFHSHSRNLGDASQSGFDRINGVSGRSLISIELPGQVAFPPGAF
eukprot:TRINITY_DN120898_c0_g1_i1.p1 TRINITY_DN120898_c0_g1~~TRINITY_DN120898_c0_g1_i1.p1  ORF type:complete len:934 (-),score=176.49 TRINITY_DN120898_c0_g1_i1:99-2900(-)